MAKKNAKKVVSKVHAKVYKGFYRVLGTKVGEQDIYKIIAKNKERDLRDLDLVRCLKNSFMFRNGKCLGE